MDKKTEQENYELENEFNSFVTGEFKKIKKIELDKTKLEEKVNKIIIRSKSLITIKKSLDTKLDLKEGEIKEVKQEMKKLKEIYKNKLLEYSKIGEEYSKCEVEINEIENLAKKEIEMTLLEAPEPKELHVEEYVKELPSINSKYVISDELQDNNKIIDYNMLELLVEAWNKAPSVQKQMANVDKTTGKINAEIMKAYLFPNLPEEKTERAQYITEQMKNNIEKIAAHLDDGGHPIVEEIRAINNRIDYNNIKAQNGLVMDYVASLNIKNQGEVVVDYVASLNEYRNNLLNDLTDIQINVEAEKAKLNENHTKEDLVGLISNLK